MKKRKKYATGTSVKNYMETPGTEIAQSQIDMAKAKHESETNPLTQGLDVLGSLAMQYGISQGGFKEIPGLEKMGVGDEANNALSLIGSLTMAMGGTVPNVPVEVEGNEVAETPQGELMEFEGPNHESGGVDVDLPEGTEIFSTRIKLDGKTMAERKKARERRKNRINKLLSKRPADQIASQTAGREASSIEKQEELDMQLQETIKRTIEQANQSMEEYMSGGQVRKKYPYGSAGIGVLEDVLKQRAQGVNPLESDISPVESPTVLPGFPDPTVNPAPKPTFLQSLLNGTKAGLQALPDQEELTTGDTVGMLGTLISTFGPGQNTLRNRAGDTPNINYFEDFGQDALQANDQAQSYSDDITAQQLRNLTLGEQGAVRRSRNNSRSVNTMRAMDLGIQQNANRERSNIMSQEAGRMMELLSQRGQLENIQDQAVMQDERERDINDRKDRDSFYSQRAQDIVTKGLGLQEMGKDLNGLKRREVIGNLLGELSKYGITIDSKGNLITKS